MRVIRNHMHQILGPSLKTVLRTWLWSSNNVSSWLRLRQVCVISFQIPITEKAELVEIPKLGSVWGFVQLH